MKKLLILLFPLLSGCGVEPDLNDLTQNMLVQTSFLDNIDFSNYTSFAIPPDTLGYVSNASQDTLVVGRYAADVVSKISFRMAKAGYVLTDKKNEPDLGVSAYVLDNQGFYQTVSYPNYMFGYPGYGYSGFYNYGFGGFYGYPLVQNFSYQTGTLVIEIIDLKNLTPDKKYQVVWVAKIGDLYNSPDPSSKVLEAVDQAFDQSPYLKK